VLTLEDSLASGQLMVPRPRPPVRPPIRVLLWPAFLLVCGLSVAWLIAQLQHDTEHGRRREEVRAELETIRGELSRELFGALHLTEGIAGLVAIEGGISEAKFHAFARELFRRNDLVHNVVVAPDNVVTLVYPVRGNERAIGLDYATRPDQWPSVERMMTERHMIVAGPVTLVQGGVGVIGRTPIYVPDSAGEPRYWGLASTVVKLDTLLGETSIASADERLELALRGIDGLGEHGSPFWGDTAVFGADPVALDVPLPFGSWQLAAIPKGGWPTSPGFVSIPFLVGGALSLALAGLLLRLLQTGHAREREEYRRRAAMAALQKAHEELELRVAARTRELSVARDAAEAADRLKSAFLATMSHELRTPLNSILGFTGIVLQGLAGPLSAEQTKQLGMVQRSAKHLLDLINDVLDISKIEAGQIELRISEFDLDASLERVVATVTPLAQKKGLSVRIVASAPIGAIESDQRRVEQILLNLLNNAIKFTERGDVTLGAELDEERQRVLLHVADTGIGIKDEDLGVLFQPFRQIDSSLQRQHEGTGLGLAICRRLTDILGGTIDVKSEWGRGTTFTVSLPTTTPLPPPSGVRGVARGKEHVAPAGGDGYR
jgi:signal transduction histidine kinase